MDSEGYCFCLLDKNKKYFNENKKKDNYEWDEWCA